MLVRYREIETVNDDVIKTVGPIAYFFYAEDTPRTRRATYHQYERGRLPGVIPFGKCMTISKKLALATMWAHAAKQLDGPTSQLMELNLQLDELAAALADCNTGQVEAAKLGSLLDATRSAISSVLKTPSAPQKSQPDKR